MNTTAIRRKKILSILQKNKMQYDLVHINIADLSKEFNLNRGSIIQDIMFFLEQGDLISFCPKIKLYQLKNSNQKNEPPEITSNKNTTTNIQPKPKASTKKITLPYYETVDYAGFDEEEIDLLKKFFLHRKEIKKPMTNHAYDLLLKTAKQFKAENIDVVLCLQKSIRRGWSDIFKPKIDEVTNNTNIAQPIKRLQTFKEIDQQNLLERRKRDEEASAKFAELVNTWGVDLITGGNSNGTNLPKWIEKND